MKEMSGVRIGDERTVTAQACNPALHARHIHQLILLTNNHQRGTRQQFILIVAVTLHRRCHQHQMANRRLQPLGSLGGDPRAEGKTGQ